MILAALTLLAGCGEKHTIDTGIDTSADLATRGDADKVVYAPVTDENGEAVTNSEGETVTEVVPAGQAAGSGNQAGTTAAGADASSAQQGESPQNEPTAAPEEAVKNGEYQLSLIPDKTEVKAGDTFTLTYHLKNCKYVACASFTVEAGENVSVTDYKSNRYSNEDGDNFDIYSNSTDEGVLFGGMITTTIDFLDDDLFTVTYRVESGAKKGEKLTFRVVPTTFLVGTDSTGAQTKDISSSLARTTISVTVN